MSEDFTPESREQNDSELHEQPNPDYRENPELHEQPNPDYRENPELHEQPVPEYHEIPNAGFNPQKIVVPKKRRDPVFYIALALAAFCILGSFGATAFITGFMAGRSMDQNNGPRIYGMQKVLILKGRPSFRGEIDSQRGQISAKVAIIQGNNGLQFSQPVVKIPSGNGIIWINQTNQVQVLLSEKMPALKLAPNQASILFLKERGGSYTLSLASDPNVTITVYIVYQP